jgi:16S rRNA (uracil1498-N3)-methyltransferase
MNSLIILQDECVDPTSAILVGGRAHYAFKTHGVTTGQRIRVAVMGVSRGEAIVERASESEVCLTIVESMPSLPFEPVDLVVGVPRPQTVKKVIQAAVMLGARSLHFVRSEKGDKSYLQSRSLEPDLIQEETIKALEQVWCAMAPDILVHRSFPEFAKEILPTLSAPTLSAPTLSAPTLSATTLSATTLSAPARACWVVDPSGAEFALADTAVIRAASAITLAIGPERGWSVAEIQAFGSAGWRVLGLGDRVMRVELAVVFVLGQVRLLARAQVLSGG